MESALQGLTETDADGPSTRGKRARARDDKGQFLPKKNQSGAINSRRFQQNTVQVLRSQNRALTTELEDMRCQVHQLQKQLGKESTLRFSHAQGKTLSHVRTEQRRVKALLHYALVLTKDDNVSAANIISIAARRMNVAVHPVPRHASAVDAAVADGVAKVLEIIARTSNRHGRWTQDRRVASQVIYCALSLASRDSSVRSVRPSTPPPPLALSTLSFLHIAALLVSLTPLPSLNFSGLASGGAT